jgi:LPS O-antigen subunit length determinant protein (WzzB/FepE family)
MDTQTLIDVVALIDARITKIQQQEKDDDPRGDEIDWYRISASTLEDFSNHLQGYIHSLQNQVENETGE